MGDKKVWWQKEIEDLEAKVARLTEEKIAIAQQYDALKAQHDEGSPNHQDTPSEGAMDAQRGGAAERGILVATVMQVANVMEGEAEAMVWWWLMAYVVPRMGTPEAWASVVKQYWDAMGKV